MPDATATDGALLRLLRELAVVTPEHLLGGVAEGPAAGLARAHLDALRDVLATARTRSHELRTATGPDPYAVVELADLASQLELLDKAAALGAGRLAARARTLRLAADVDAAAAELVPQLAAWARRLGPAATGPA